MREFLNPHLPVVNPLPQQPEASVQWVILQSKIFNFVAIVDAHNVREETLFCVTSRGELVELRTGDHSSFTNHGSPEGTILSPVMGAVIKATSGLGSLFVRTEMGTLAELWWDAEQEEFEWVDHGTPGEGVYISSPPGAMINERSIFMVTSKSTLAERYWDGHSWIWVDHGRPEKVQGKSLVPLTLARVRGVSLDSRTLYFMLTTGQLAKRSWDGTKWIWVVHDVPETGSAPCTAAATATRRRAACQWICCIPQ